MQATHWATVNVTTTMADPSAPLTETTTAMQLGTVVSTTVQAGGLMPAWQQTWMDGITVGGTVGWPTVSTGVRGTSWQMDKLENATPSRGWRWRQDPGISSEHPKDNDDNSHGNMCYSTMIIMSATVLHWLSVWTSLYLEQLSCHLSLKCRWQLIEINIQIH